jgi:hypothetical protein
MNKSGHLLALASAIAAVAFAAHPAAAAAAAASARVPQHMVAPVKAVKHKHRTVVYTKTTRRVLHHKSTSTSSSTASR